MQRESSATPSVVQASGFSTDQENTPLLVVGNVAPMEIARHFWPFALLPSWLGLGVVLGVGGGRPILSLLLALLAAALISVGFVVFGVHYKSLVGRVSRLRGHSLAVHLQPATSIQACALPMFTTLLSLGATFPWLVREWQTQTLAARVDREPALEFVGDPNETNVSFGLGFVLTALTFGAFGPWWFTRTMRWRWGSMRMGERRVRFECEPESMLGLWVRGWCLSIVTGGAYVPWFLSTLLQCEARGVR